MGTQSERYFYAKSIIDDLLSTKSDSDPSDGLAFERFVISGLNSFFTNKSGINIFKGTRSDDKLHGTDFFVDFADYPKPIRCDFTLNFSGKDHMPFISQYIIELKDPPPINDHTIHLGVRTGNNDHEFNEPVIVVGMNITPHQIYDEVYASYDNDLPYAHALEHLLKGEAIMKDDQGHIIGSQHSLYALADSIDQTYRALLLQRSLCDGLCRKDFRKNPRVTAEEYNTNLENLKFKDLPSYDEVYDDGYDLDE